MRPINKLAIFLNKIVKFFIGSIFFLVGALVLVASWPDIKNIPLTFSKPYKEYQSILESSFKGKKPPLSLDLSSIKSVDWKDAVIWHPYTSDCTLGIAFKDGKKCAIQDENQMHIFLVKNNEVAAKIPTNELIHFQITQKKSPTKNGALLLIENY